MLGSIIRKFLALVVLAGVQAFAQTAAQSEREEMYSRYLKFGSLTKGGSVRPQWMMDGSTFWYAEGAPDNTVIWRVDPKANAKTALFDTARVRKALAPLLGHEPPHSGLPFNEFSFLNGEKQARFTVENRDFVLQLGPHLITLLPSSSEDQKNRTDDRFVGKGLFAGARGVREVNSPDHRWSALTRDHNLWLRSSADDRSVQMTTDGIHGYEWDVEGAVWSPNSLRLAVRKADLRQMHSIPIIHWLKSAEEVEWVRYPKAGAPLSQNELFTWDILSKRLVRVDVGLNVDKYFFVVGWRPDGSELYFLKMSRETKTLDLMAANPTTGATRSVLTETRDTFIGGLQFLNTGWSKVFTMIGGGDRFLWMSERDGWNHLYLYRSDGTLIRRLTEGSFPVLQVVAVDEKSGWIYFTAHAEKRLYDTHLYRVNLDGKGFTRLTDGIGQHNVEFAPSKEFFLDTHSSTGRPPAVELKAADGTVLQTLSKAHIEALGTLNWSPPEEFVVKAADKKTELYGVLYKPHDFDPSRSYPVVDFIYAGPQTTVVPRTFADVRGLHPQALAQLGFITFVVDGRGTPERGKEFQDVVYGNVGRNEIPDHVAVLRELGERRPYMDLGRVGILGHSYGGYFALRAALMAPDVYHVAVSSAPVADLAETPANGIEPYLDLPQNNREGYEYAANLRLASSLRGKLLLMIGTSDDDVRFSSAMKIADALIRANKPYEMVVLPEQPHSLVRMGSVYAYWQETVRRYFQECLRPEQSLPPSKHQH
jgi:dipeptidyl-peptidase-4